MGTDRVTRDRKQGQGGGRGGGRRRRKNGDGNDQGWWQRDYCTIEWI
jgi:hypothetical protein